MNIKEIMTEAHKTAVLKGFYEKEVPMPTALALIHSELSEAVEADRKGDLENRAEEMADVVIRICDTAEYHGLEIESISDPMHSYFLAANPDFPRFIMGCHAKVTDVYWSWQRHPALYLAGAFGRLLAFILCNVKLFDIDLEKAITEKMERNKLRPYKHGKAY